jgi:hypothetical protein
MDRDEFVEDLYEKAGLPLVRVPVRPTYNTNELGVLFKEALIKTKITTPGLSVNEASSGTSRGIQAKSIPNPILEPVEGSGSSIAASNQVPVCPKCGQPMVLRTAEVGVNKGKRFWGCVNYPKCKVIMAID